MTQSTFAHHYNNSTTVVIPTTNTYKENNNYDNNNNKQHNASNHSSSSSSSSIEDLVQPNPTTTATTTTTTTALDMIPLSTTTTAAAIDPTINLITTTTSNPTCELLSSRKEEPVNKSAIHLAAAHEAARIVLGDTTDEDEDVDKNDNVFDHNRNHDDNDNNYNERSGGRGIPTEFKDPKYDDYNYYNYNYNGEEDKDDDFKQHQQQYQKKKKDETTNTSIPYNSRFSTTTASTSTTTATATTPKQKKDTTKENSSSSFYIHEETNKTMNKEQKEYYQSVNNKTCNINNNNNDDTYTTNTNTNHNGMNNNNNHNNIDEKYYKSNDYRDEIVDMVLNRRRSSVLSIGPDGAIKRWDLPSNHNEQEEEDEVPQNAKKDDATTAFSKNNQNNNNSNKVDNNLQVAVKQTTTIMQRGRSASTSGYNVPIPLPIPPPPTNKPIRAVSSPGAFRMFRGNQRARPSRQQRPLDDEISEEFSHSFPRTTSTLNSSLLLSTTTTDAADATAADALPSTTTTTNNAAAATLDNDKDDENHNIFKDDNNGNDNSLQSMTQQQEQIIDDSNNNNNHANSLMNNNDIETAITADSRRISTSGITLVEAFSVPELAEVIAIPEDEIYYHHSLLSTTNTNKSFVEGGSGSVRKGGGGGSILSFTNNSNNHLADKSHNIDQNDSSSSSKGERRNNNNNNNNTKYWIWGTVVCIILLLIITIGASIGVAVGLLSKNNDDTISGSSNDGNNNDNTTNDNNNNNDILDNQQQGQNNYNDNNNNVNGNGEMNTPPTNTIGGGDYAVTERTLQIIHSNENESGFQDYNTLEEKILHYSSLVRGLQMLNVPASIHLSAGDLTIPGIFYDAAKEVSSLAASGVGGLGDITMLNAMGINAVALGNQDLASGLDDFATLLTFANFPYLSVNLDFSSVILNSNNDNNIPEIIIGPDASPCKDVAGQIVKSCYIETNIGRVGIIGRSPSDLFFLISDPNKSVPGLDYIGGRHPETNLPYLDSSLLIQEQVQLLEDPSVGGGRVDIIILLDQDFSNINESIIGEPQLSEELKGIDIIIGEIWGETLLFAQSDSFGPFNYLRDGETADVNYPIVRKDSNGDRVFFINTADTYRYVGNLIVTFDENGVISSWDGRSGPIATTPEAVALMEDVVGVSPLEPHPIVATTLELLQNTPSFVDSFSVLGTTVHVLEGGRPEIRSRETNLGRLVADSTLWWATQGGYQKLPLTRQTAVSDNHDITLPPADFALKNGGGIRASILGPVITRLSILSALPFNNELTIVEINAGQLIAALENAVSGMPLLDVRTPHLAGIRIEVNASMPAIDASHYVETPSRLKRVILEGKKGKNKENGDEEEPANNGNGNDDEVIIIDNYTLMPEFVNRKFVVATNSFLAAGGDRFQSINDGTLLWSSSSSSSDGSTTGRIVGEQQILEEYILNELGGFVDIRDPPPEPHRLVKLVR